MEEHKTEINKTSNSLEGSRISIFFSRLKWNVVNTFTKITESKWRLIVIELVVVMALLIAIIIEETEGSY